MHLPRIEVPCNFQDFPWMAWTSSCLLLTHQSRSWLPVISSSNKITQSANLPQLLQVLFIEIYYDLHSLVLVPAVILEATWLVSSVSFFALFWYRLRKVRVKTLLNNFSIILHCRLVVFSTYSVLLHRNPLADTLCQFIVCFVYCEIRKMTPVLLFCCFFLCVLLLLLFSGIKTR